ncbi:hypothetical protein [Hymenobacter sp. B81]|uniref:hypothetical protein n=1 Tax=Hymenobacter sp. B81 TaxID=3344878 RepID=UPI0037DD200E
MSDAAPRPSADEQWENLLRQWRHPHTAAQPGPHFYGRVRARLTPEVAGEPPWPGWLRWPAYAATLAALVLALSGDQAPLRPASYDARPGEPPAAWPGR